MECLENGGTFCFLNVWWYLKELHLELQSTQRLERKETIPPKDVTEHYIRLEKIFRDRFPPCLQSLHCSILLCSYFQLYSPDMLAESWDWQPWGKQIDQGGELGKNLLSWASRMPCCFLCVCQRSQGSELGISWVLSSTPFDNSYKIISKKKLASYWKQHILKGSQKAISEDLYSLQHLLLLNRFFLKNIILSGAIASPLYFKSFTPQRLWRKNLHFP